MSPLLICAVLVSFSQGKLLFNKYSDSPWEATKEPVVDGEELISEQQVVTLHFPTGAANLSNIDIIANFPFLEELYIDSYTLTEIPVLANLPRLRKLSLAKNKLRIVNNASISTSTLEVLNFAGNKIDTIYNNAFGSRATEVYLTCNALTKIIPSWFSNPEYLFLLHIGGNKIRILEENTFKDFTSLKRLELRNNGLKILQDNSLKGPPNMVLLHLGYNNLTELRAEVFGDTSSRIYIHYLDLQYNSLSFVSDDLLESIDVSNLRIWGNPWQCACKSKIQKWWDKKSVYSANMTFDGDSPCVSSASFSRSCVEIAHEDIFKEFRKIFRPFRVRIC